jgi:hypothetical protein
MKLRKSKKKIKLSEGEIEKNYFSLIDYYEKSISHKDLKPKESAEFQIRKPTS